MTTRGRRAKSMSPSAIAKREKYAADKLAKQQAVQSTPEAAIDPPVLDADLQVEITPNEAPKLSLKDRLFGGTSTPLPGSPTKAKTVKKGQRGKQIDASLLAKTFPSMIAAMTASYAQKLIKDPYKPCAPSQKEVVDVIGPLFSILSRRIEIVGTASEDIIDLISSVLAGFVAGVRIHITYLSIQEAVEKAKLNGSNATRGNGNGHASTHPSAGPIRIDTGTQFDTSQENLVPIGLVVRTDSSDGDDYADSPNGDSGATKPEAALFADLSRRDRAGRVRLGLIAR